MWMFIAKVVGSDSPLIKLGFIGVLFGRSLN